ncbi:MAG: hypothetical protein ACE5GW_09315, partial [Planctomycetota bacterium]
MFTVLTGEAPFPGETTPEVLERITSTDPPFPREVAAGIPEDLQAICLACLARDPAQRPSAWEVATDLGRFLGGEPARLRPALYGDILRRRIAEHTSELGGWERQGMISTVERDRLHLVYRRILADEDHWIIDARRLTLPQTALYTGTWVVVVAAVLLVWLVRDDLSAAARSLIPLGGSLALLGIGVVAQRRRELLASAAFLTGAVLSVVPAVLSLLGELGMLAEPVEGVTQLLEPTFTNGQLLAASLAGLTLSMGALARLRLTGFAWTTAALTVASALGLLLILGWLDREPEIQALWCLPLVALEGVALLFERRGRVRWALPFHLTALLVLVLALDVIASEGPTLALLGVAEAMPEPGLFLNHERQTAFSLALNGLLFILLMVLAERARSLDLRRGARILELVAPIHLLGALYANAQEQRDLQSVDIDVGIYLAAVVLLLALGPWRARWRFLLGGLLGLALGSHLLIDLGLVSKVPFALGLGATGLAGAIATYAYLVISPRPREGSGEPGGRMGEESTTKAARRHEEMHEEEGTGSS